MNEWPSRIKSPLVGIVVKRYTFVEVVGMNKVIVYYVPRRIMRVITRRATMLAGDRSQGVAEAKPRQSRDKAEARSALRTF